jgi:hypothetical protein
MAAAAGARARLFAVAVDALADAEPTDEPAADDPPDEVADASELTDWSTDWPSLSALSSPFSAVHSHAPEEVFSR